MADLELSETEISILLVDDARIRELNRAYLHRDRPTNVIAFPMKEGEFSLLNPHLLGDLVISVDTARRQSSRFGLNPMEMILFLMIHGLLHLVGYEHEATRKGAREMAMKEKELFRLATQKDALPLLRLSLGSSSGGKKCDGMLSLGDRKAEVHH